jgi:hypothetical protein
MTSCFCSSNMVKGRKKEQQIGESDIRRSPSRQILGRHEKRLISHSRNYLRKWGLLPTQIQMKGDTL